MFVSLVERNCKKHHDIQWYASQLCLSPKYVANVVKEVTGLTAGDCIDVNIIRQAKALMQIKTLMLQQISDSLGFQNQSHFGTFFHRHTGLLPKAFRTKQK
ncbi:MAG: AraC family transcriptional regulator [Paludibacteraceae bacterium]|nr:AraC family transcriptional regulator [Paludibacteraceae bacterium]